MSDPPAGAARCSAAAPGGPDPVVYRREAVDPDAYRDILVRSGLAERRPQDAGRLARMLAGASFTITARAGDDGRLLGLARALTDWAFACYLCDLMVCRSVQRQGIGRELLRRTRHAAGPESMCLLLAAPDAATFYDRIGMERCDSAFLVPRDR